MARPTLTLWLDTLNEIPQLETLALHSASPVAARFPFDVERTVTLPSLTHLDISASLSDCALAAAHLDLPALTSLCLTAIDPHTNRRGVQNSFGMLCDTSMDLKTFGLCKVCTSAPVKVA